MVLRLRRGAPHLHAAARGAIPRAIFRQVVAATDFALWWPSFDEAVYEDRVPVWSGPEHGYVDPDTGEVLPTWADALDRLDKDEDAKPAHVMRFGKQLDLQGVIQPEVGVCRSSRGVHSPGWTSAAAAYSGCCAAREGCEC